MNRREIIRRRILKRLLVLCKCNAISLISNWLCAEMGVTGLFISGKKLVMCGELVAYNSVDTNHTIDY